VIITAVEDRGDVVRTNRQSWNAQRQVWDSEPCSWRRRVGETSEHGKIGRAKEYGAIIKADRKRRIVLIRIEVVAGALVADRGPKCHRLPENRGIVIGRQAGCGGSRNDSLR